MPSTSSNKMVYDAPIPRSRSKNFRPFLRLPLTLVLSVGILGLMFMTAGPGYVQLQAQNRMSFSRVSQNGGHVALGLALRDRKSTRLNSSHLGISYAVFCLKKKKNKQT